MRVAALACDYDGTIATEGRLERPVANALDRLRRRGCRLVLVTGRDLADLRSVCPRLERFDRVVAENGGLLHRPRAGTTRRLGKAPPRALVRALEQKGVTPLTVGRTIVATRDPWGPTVRAALRRLRLDWHVILNKGAVMVLPQGVSKASGLLAALDELGIAPADALAVGDAENDIAMLEACGRGVAVRNALAAVKVRADWVTRRANGAGVAELVSRILSEETLVPRAHARA